MIRVAFGPETPEDIVALARKVNGFVSFGPVTEAAGADGLAATVVVGNQIIFTVRWIVASAYPGNRGRFRARRAGRHAATATGT